MTHRFEFNVKHLAQGKHIWTLQIMLSRNIHLYISSVWYVYRQRIQIEFGVSRKHEISF